MIARVLTQSIQQDPAELMCRIGVHCEGVRIMAPKAEMKAVYLSGVSAYVARILKQDLLSIGGDCAMAADALLRNKRTDCLVMATRAQLSDLCVRLLRQSETLKAVGASIMTALTHSDCSVFNVKTCHRTITIKRPLVMGILNITSDSFSGDGLMCLEKVVESAGRMVDAGVDMFDVGAESSRPGARPVSEKQELERVVPVVKALVRKFRQIPVSVDTYKPVVAESAIDAGAVMINDITGLKNKQMRSVVARTGAGVCIMHMQATPRTMQKNPRYTDVNREIFDFFVKRTAVSREDGISDAQIVLDVGIGFGKRLEDNLRLLAYHQEFTSLGYPLLLGVSRKSFLGSIVNEPDPVRRQAATVAALTLGIDRGARILRVHDVAQAVQAVRVSQAILNVASTNT